MTLRKKSAHKRTVRTIYTKETFRLDFNVEKPNKALVVVVVVVVVALQ